MNIPILLPLFKNKITVTNSNYSEKLSAISDVIIANDNNIGALYTALHQMKSIFQEVAIVNPDSPEYITDLHHATGKAIGPRWAELCIDDLMRTKRFSKGTYHAIVDTLAKKKENLWYFCMLEQVRLQRLSCI